MFVAIVNIADLTKEQFECLGHVIEINFLAHLDFVCVDLRFVSEKFS